MIHDQLSRKGCGVNTIHVVSVSGGKDSAATLLLAINRVGRDNVRAIFCDTGNEHEEVYKYLDYLEQALDITIDRLKASFTEEIAAKRDFIARDARTRREYDTTPICDALGRPVWARDARGNRRFKLKKSDGAPFCAFIQKTRKVGGGRKTRWSNKAKRRALAVLYPTGNPFLDLCLWKGRFPSRKAQFCTEELKRNMAVAYQLELIDAGHRVVSWQGVRRDESQNRRNAKKIERLAPRLYAFRPLVEWSALDVFDYCAQQGLQPNPLYLQGCGRVGCMPCINVGKEEITQIDSRWPEHLARPSQWEKLVSQASKRGFSTFFNKELHDDNWSDRRVHEANQVSAVIQWARTTRGGVQFNLLADLIEPTACASAYGLCE
ncbi:phosphoadenosine phosphosulfate reductase family protein [Chromobacterium haemolyticum]|uniref:phosphoadenosine phosphosulfate reductase domain-containing protein n=1 Tax=Chromobacterium haemolyticum TaxID=394935 RepID=UPI0017472DAD|nr:phosphoadenosine phosphosulfate reductase family protein [Chromobacterium haemolyticum]QOD81858.1 phosphoadenosine phosphosulfate reductase family protein [Chromobacterium haemolyticum]